jgi:hypothetical protein
MTLNFTEATAYRKEWMPNLFQASLRNACVAYKIMDVVNKDIKYIENPYGDAGVITQQAIAGTYNVDTFTVTADTLTVTEEFVWSEHVYDFERLASVADVKGSRMREATGKMATAVDKYALNALLDGGTGTFTTPAGGFTRDNIIPILGGLATKFAGYNESFASPYLVLESTDVDGLVQAGMTNGFNFADTWLRNGLLGTTQMGGFNIYVVRTGTFVTATLGTLTATNSGHRLAGIEGVATLAQPGGKTTWMEKEVSGKTGVELAAVCYAGVAVWYQKKTLTVDITLA